MDPPTPTYMLYIYIYVYAYKHVTQPKEKQTSSNETTRKYYNVIRVVDRLVFVRCLPIGMFLDVPTCSFVCVYINIERGREIPTYIYIYISIYIYICREIYTCIPMDPY